MAINSLVKHTQLRQLNELAGTWRWSISFIRTPNSSSIILPPGNSFDIQTNTSELPRRDDNQLIDVNIKGHHIQRPGISDVTHTFTVTCIETIDNHIRELLRTWQLSYWNYDTGLSEKFEDIAANILIRTYDGRGNGVWDYLLYNCIITGSDTGGEANSDSEAYRPTLTFYYDDFEQGKSLAK